MKQLLITAILSQQFLMASTITLEEILSTTKTNTILEKRLTEESLALDAKASAEIENTPLKLNHALSRNNGKDLSGYEHYIGLSKEIVLGDTQRLQRQQSKLTNQAYIIEQRRELISLENQIKNLYHQYCLEQSYLQTFQEEYENITTLYAKKVRAFELGEIAKTELLQIELEQKRLQIKFDELRQQKQSNQKLLLSLTTQNSDATPSCQDTYPITPTIALTQEPFQMSSEAYQKRMESTQVGLKRYKKKIDSIELSMGYTQELESDIYTIGVSVPLNFTSNKSEYKRAALMHQSSAIELEKEQELEKRSYLFNRLKDRLKRNYSTIQAKEENINNYQSSLLLLMKKSYDYGESSVIEYLLSQQRLYTLQQELLKTKKEYYKTLFELYTISEITENK